MKNKNPNCLSCQNELTDEDMEYIGGYCEACEDKWYDRLTEWRQGANIPELDQIFGCRCCPVVYH